MWLKVEIGLWNRPFSILSRALKPTALQPSTRTIIPSMGGYVPRRLLAHASVVLDFVYITSKEVYELINKNPFTYVHMYIQPKTIHTYIYIYICIYI